MMKNCDPSLVKNLEPFTEIVGRPANPSARIGPRKRDDASKRFSMAEN